MEEEEKTAKVIDLMRRSSEAGDKSGKPPKPPPMLAHKLIINGGTHHYGTVPARLEIVLLIPREPVVSKAQRNCLMDLCDAWVARHNAMGARPMTRADARQALAAKAKVESHRLIPAARYEELVAWLLRQISKLERDPSEEMVKFGPALDVGVEEWKHHQNRAASQVGQATSTRAVTPSLST